MGKIGYIDLSAETISEYPWKQWEQYLGGKILNQRLILELLTGNISAFSEETPVILSTGPLTGTGAPGSARFDLASVSPKDNRPAFCNSGGDFGICMKRAGYDALILTGRCREKRWLEINGDGIAFHDASELWGSGARECQALLTRHMGDQRFGTLCIGPAGENQVRFATVIASGHSTGRSGIGAILGWKNLKAVTVAGKNEISLFDPEGAAKVNRQWHAILRRRGQSMECTDGSSHCTGCPLHCARRGRRNESILNDLGMDAISAADAVQWAQEQGICVPDLYEDIAYRRGIGDKLADGVPKRRGKTGNRRENSYQAIAAAFHLPPDTPETKRFCQNLTEAISAAGQCMFTVSALEEDAILCVQQMLQLVTGIEMDLERLLAIGEQSQELERQIRTKYK